MIHISYLITELLYYRPPKSVVHNMRGLLAILAIFLIICFTSVSPKYLLIDVEEGKEGNTTSYINILHNEIYFAQVRFFAVVMLICITSRWNIPRKCSKSRSLQT